MQDIFIQYLSWHFSEMPKKILAAWKNFLKFNLDYFSIFLLLKTFFSPLHKYSWSFPRGFYPQKYLEIIISNLAVRLIGAVSRFFFIVVFLLAEIFIVFAGIIIFLGWLILPAILLAGLILGIRIIF